MLGWLPAEGVRYGLAAAFLAMALWLLWEGNEEERASAEGEESPFGAGWLGAFTAAAGLFFLAEMGDKTQLLALGLGARFESVVPVVLGSVTGVLIINAPLFWGGQWLAARVCMVWARRGAVLRPFRPYGVAVRRVRAVACASRAALSQLTVRSVSAAKASAWSA